ncbi:MAG: hypothetical protein R2939_08610 [Kofleriaceae bacterium]
MVRLRSLGSVLAVTATLAASACGAAPGRGTTPASTGAAAYAAALRADDPRAAYDLLAESVRRELDFDEFAVQWRESAAERAAQLAALEDGLRDQPDLGERARVTLADGALVPLARERGAWRMSSPLVTPTNATQAADAFRLLAAAIEDRDLQALLRVLTTRRREGLSRQLAGFLAGLDAHLGQRARWIEYADRAELAWSHDGFDYKIIARKEGDQWRIDDLDVTPAATDRRSP